LRSRLARWRWRRNPDVVRRLPISKNGNCIMDKSVRSKAEERFNKIKQQDIKALKEREKTQQEDAAKVTRLKALRLAKEAADKEAADKEAAEKAAAKKPAAKKARSAAPAADPADTATA
jgi:hypothetical protein